MTPPIPTDRRVTPTDARYPLRRLCSWDTVDDDAAVTMPKADLASPRPNDAGRHQGDVHTTSPESETIQSPKPCAQAPHSLRRFQSATANGSRPTEHDRLPKAYHSHGSYYLRGSGLTSTASSLDLEKSDSAQETTPQRREHDPGKAVYHPRVYQNMSDNIHASFSDDGTGEENNSSSRRLQEDKAINILLFLSGPCVALSSANAVWTFLALAISLLSQPIRLCARQRPTFGQQLSGLLGPALNLQLRCIYTPLPPHANEEISYHAWIFVAVHILSPLLSLGVMFLAWVLAVYWLSSVVVGDPAGMDRRDDGRETVLWLRGWWERLLQRSVKNE
ncbi:hypothetical protein LTR01_000377 [Friedmanniomyces endolithicus]|nr:hypothetical protein LTS09_008027 [Friedmanniomyces endolithicus]KAK0316628.1 hypothetical protein LTR01_000377 [Friedmanniomyces endolithicus]KAK0834805.1 hypothetical protein LTR73_001095 [Friedmanniomyces endolithicus]